MKIQFMGAARTVTGSCYILETSGHRFAVDCGMHQGNAEIEKRNWDLDSYEPERIEFFLLTHAHMDHSGLLPRMVQKGFQGQIYTTPPTRDLLQIMLLDSAHIQEMEAHWRNKRRLRWGEKALGPLYTQEDAEATLPLVAPCSYEEPFEPFPGLSVKFRDAGHILGSSLVELKVQENGRRSKVVFSGDVGRPNQLLVEDPTLIREADFLFLESTYGDRNHKNEEDSLNELAEAVAYSYSRKEKVIIPAFAVERTQELIYTLYLLSRKGKLPKDMPVYLDSPMAIRATEVFRSHPEYFDEDTRKLLEAGKDPLTLPQLHLSETTEDSKAINQKTGPAIVISASGMADAGRIRHHLRHNLWREGASIVFVGFQAMGTTGRKIVDGAKKVRLFHEEIAVKARIFTINGFSAHAGQSQVLDWLSHFQNPALQVFLVHGEYSAQQKLADLIRQRFKFKVLIPDYLEEVSLKLGEELKRKEYPERAAPRIDWAYLMGDLDTKMAQLRGKAKNLESRTWVEQTEFRDRLLELNRAVSELISES